MYRAEATSIEGFVQQLVCYIASGYRWYVTGRVPEQKEPRGVDANLIEKYEIALSKYQRAHRKRAGGANVQYLRFERFFVLIATSPVGGHPFSRVERSALRDIRKQPVRIAGYSISSRRDGSELRKGIERWRAHVRIDRETFVQLRDFYLEEALRKKRVDLESELRAVPFEPYAPVRRQLMGVVRKVNEQRKVVGLRPLRPSCLRFRRRQVRPFEPDSGPEEGRTALGMLFYVCVLVIAWRVGVLPWAITGLLAISIYRSR